MFPVKSLHHCFLLDPQNRTIRHRGRRPHAQRLTCQAPFPEKITATQYSDRCFLPSIGDNGESYLALLDIEHSIAGLPLGEDGLSLFERYNLPAHANGGKERIWVEIAFLLRSYNYAHV